MFICTTLNYFNLMNKNLEVFIKFIKYYYLKYYLFAATLIMEQVFNLLYLVKYYSSSKNS
jgi:hypothetical protein